MDEVFIGDERDEIRQCGPSAGDDELRLVNEIRNVNALLDAKDIDRLLGDLATQRNEREERKDGGDYHEGAGVTIPPRRDSAGRCPPWKGRRQSASLSDGWDISSHSYSFWMSSTSLALSRESSVTGHEPQEPWKKRFHGGVTRMFGSPSLRQRDRQSVWAPSVHVFQPVPLSAYLGCHIRMQARL